MSFLIFCERSKQLNQSKMNETFILVCLLCFSLTSCVTNNIETAPKQTLGKILGAGLGGLLGAQVGSGKGQLAAVAAGVLAGAYFGDEVGSSLDRADKLFMDKNAKKSLEYARTGETTEWINPDSGNSGSFTPIKTYTASSGANCREFETTILIEGKTETAIGRACRQNDGTWKIAS